MKDPPCSDGQFPSILLPTGSEITHFFRCVASDFYNNVSLMIRSAVSILISTWYLLLREMQQAQVQMQPCERPVFQMKVSLPTAVSTGSFRKRHPPGRRIRAISARISALCRVQLPGTAPARITSKLDSLCAAEKKEDCVSNHLDPRSRLPSPPSPPRLRLAL